MFQDIKSLWEKLCCIVKRITLIENQIGNITTFTCADALNCPQASLVDNGNGTFTYTTAAGIPTVFDSNVSIVNNPDGSIEITLLNGSVINIPAPTVVFDDQVLTASDTNTVDLTLTPTAPSGADSQVDYTVEANVKYQDSLTILMSEDASGLKSDIKFHPVTPGNVVFVQDPLGLWAYSSFATNVTDSITVGINGGGDIIADLNIDTVTPGNVTLTTSANGVAANVTIPADINTTISNTIVGHKIADYTNEASTVVDINESITTVSLSSLSPANILTLTHNNESGVPYDVTADLSSLANVPVETDCEIVGDGSLLDPIKIGDNFYDLLDMSTVTGDITTTDITKDLVEAKVVKDGCKLRVFVDNSFIEAQYTENDLSAITDLAGADFVEISLENITASQNINTWFGGLAGTKLGQQITIHYQGATTGFVINYTRETTGNLGVHSQDYTISSSTEFMSFTVVKVGDNFGLKLN